MKTRIFSAICLIFSVFLCGCADMNGEKVSTGLGGIIGGLAGNKIGSGSGRTVGTVAGVAIGAFIGNRIGKYLDAEGTKRTAAASAKTADTGQSQQFRTSSGAMVTTSSVPSSSGSVPKPRPTTNVAAALEPECRTVRQTIVLQDGKSESEDVRMCKGPDGWQPA
jgi:surface antigen